MDSASYLRGLSLSTMWSKDRYQHMREFVQDARRFGYSHLELYPSLTQDGLQELMELGSLSVSSIHSPCPDMAAHRDVPSSKLSLSGLDEEIRRGALERDLATVDLAAKVGAKAVVVHAGEVEVDESLVVQLHQLFARGLQSSAEFESIKWRLIEERAAKAEAHLEASKESIEVLLDRVSEKGIRLGLENRVHYQEIPSLEEMEQFLVDFEGTPLGYWHDVGHAEVQERLGFESHLRWFSRLKDKIIGVHLHDVRGIQDHLAPGIGDMDWDCVAENIPEDATRVCEIGEWNRAMDVHKAVVFLKEKGVVRF